MQLITRSIDEFVDIYLDVTRALGAPRLYLCVLAEPLPAPKGESGAFRVCVDSETGEEQIICGQIISCWSFRDTREGQDCVMYRHLESRSFSESDPVGFNVQATADELISRIRSGMDGEGLLEDDDGIIRIYYGVVIDGYSDLLARQIQSVGFDSGSGPVIEG